MQSITCCVLGAARLPRPRLVRWRLRPKPWMRPIACRPRPRSLPLRRLRRSRRRRWPQRRRSWCGDGALEEKNTLSKVKCKKSFLFAHLKASKNCIAPPDLFWPPAELKIELFLMRIERVPERKWYIHRTLSTWKCPPASAPD